MVNSATKFGAAYVWNPNSTLQRAEFRQEGSPHTDKHYCHSFTYDGRNQLRSADYEYHDGGITQMNRQNGTEVVDFEYA